MISIIAARSRNNVIGRNNDLPWYLPADLQHFKMLTLGKTVVMGRKTFESIVARINKPLPGRHNVVVTRSTDFAVEGVTVMHDVSRVAALEGEVFVIGGAQLYDQLIHLADRLYITEVHTVLDGDASFPKVDPSLWRETKCEKHQADEKNQFDFDFVVYERAHKS